MVKEFFSYISGFLILVFILFVCNIISKSIAFVIPTPILGIIVLFLLLQFKIIKEERIKNICEFLLKYMPLLFIPFLVGIVSYYGLIVKQLVPIVLNIAISAALTMVITAFVVESIIKYTRLKKMRNSKND